jgi:hypothetical protein
VIELKILEARFKVGIKRKEYEASANPQKLVDMPGLRWKIYGFDDLESMATGIYLFDDEEVMKRYMENLRKAANATEFLSDFELKVWDVQEALSNITKAPI